MPKDLTIEEVYEAAEVGDARLVEDGDRLFGAITLTDKGWRASKFPGAVIVMREPGVVRYEQVMEAWSARSTWGEPDEDKGQS